MTYRGEKWIEGGRETAGEKILQRADVYDAFIRGLRLHGQPTRAQMADLLLMMPEVRASIKAGNKEWCLTQWHNFIANFLHDDVLAQGLNLRGVIAVPHAGSFATHQFFDDATESELWRFVDGLDKGLANDEDRRDQFVQAIRERPLYGRCNPPKRK